MYTLYSYLYRFTFVWVYGQYPLRLLNYISVYSFEPTDISDVLVIYFLIQIEWN